MEDLANALDGVDEKGSAAHGAGGRFRRFCGSGPRAKFGSVGRVALALHNWMCRLSRMPTNLAIDDDLLGEAQKVGGHRTKKDTVNEALREYIQRRRQAKVVELFGKIDFDSLYDYKKQRQRT